MRDLNNLKRRIELRLEPRQIVTFVISVLVALVVVFVVGLKLGTKQEPTANSEIFGEMEISDSTILAKSPPILDCSVACPCNCTRITNESHLQDVPTAILPLRKIRGEVEFDLTERTPEELAQIFAEQAPSLIPKTPNPASQTWP